jgi:multiple sugar transport system ATP-binding protein
VLGSQSVGLGEETLAAHPALRSYAGKTVVLGIRPEDLEDAALASEATPHSRLRGKVKLREALGSEIMVHFTVDAKQAVTEHVIELAEDVDEAAVQSLQERPSETTMIGRFGARSRVAEGEAVDVAVDTRNLHFFDPETGSGIYDDSNEKGAS